LFPRFLAWSSERRRGIPAGIHFNMVTEDTTLTRRWNLVCFVAWLFRTTQCTGYADCVKPLPTEDLDLVLEHTLPLWERARGRRVFISGGTGFFGAWLLESLAYCNRKLGLGLSATVLSRDPGAFARRMPHLAGERSIQMLQGDVRDFAFPPEEFEFVIHAAAATSTAAASQPLELLSTLIDGTKRMLAFAKERGAMRFLFTSSGAVYGRQPENVSHIPEDYFGGPEWLDANAAYAEGKRVSEQMCSLYARESGIDFVVARCFAFVGPHLPLDQHFAIGNFIADALAGRNIAVRGDGTPMRSYLYGADLAIWLCTMLLRDSLPGSNPHVFNVGSGEAISIRDLAQVVVDELDPSLKVEVAKAAIAGEPRLQYVPDVHRAENSLGLRQTIGLREAIRRTAAWHR
jgi:nucleoside-diphosphate-sugar epimerase